MSRSNDICAQITDLIGDLSAMQGELTGESESAAQSAARVIASEQQRIFAQAHFLRDKKNHVYKDASGSLIKIIKRKTGRARVKMLVGFDTDTIREYPELLVIEFGRPGKSPRHSGSKTRETKKRKSVEKGIFPDYANVMPIRVGFQLAKEEALRKYADLMFNRAQELFRR